jgi:Ca2+-binding RTX toxin-like protein
VQQVSGLDVVVATNDDAAEEIQTAQGIDMSAQHFVAVQTLGAATAGAGCAQATATAVILSFEGADVVRGEGGNDSVSAGKEEPAANAADVVDGGPGFDSIPDVDADYNRGFDDDVSVSVDGVANDGEAGEGDNVIAVEKLRVTADHATVIGSATADDFFVEANTSTIRGLGGNDRLVAYDGHDSIEGGDGADYLEGGFGNDVLDGGPGREQVSCGIGSDTAQVDRSDVVDSSCESVSPAGRPSARRRS